MNNEKGNNHFWLGFMLGGIFGALIIFLLGTEKGKRLAKKIIEDSNLAGEDIEEKIDKLKTSGENIIREAEDVKEKVAKKVDSKKGVSNRLISKMDEALTKIENIQKKGAEATRSVRHRYFKKKGRPLVS